MDAFPFDVVAFDLDGTLADTAPDLTAALNHALGEFGRPPVPEASVRHMIGHGARALLRQGLGASGGADEALVERGYPVMIDYYTQHIADRTRPFPGLEPALDELAARGVTLAICTNKLEALTHRLIVAFGWEGRFASIVGGDTIPQRKPDAAPLHEAIRRAGGGRAAYVGDSITDIDTARAAEVPVVAVSFGFPDRPPAELGADRLIEGYDELIPTLEALGAAASVERRSDRELVVARTFKAPAALVFTAWTDPALFRRWWVPSSFGLTVVSLDVDVRTGGTYRIVMNHPASGEPMAFHGRYLEVVPNERIVWTNEEGEGEGAVTDVTFEDKDGETLVVVSDRYPSKKNLDEAIASGSTGGWLEQFEQLELLVETIRAEPSLR